MSKNKISTYQTISALRNTQNYSKADRIRRQVCGIQKKTKFKISTAKFDYVGRHTIKIILRLLYIIHLLATAKLLAR